MPHLTKTRLSLGLECSIKLIYLEDAYFANANAPSVFLQALAEGDYQVGGLAKCPLPDGI